MKKFLNLVCLLLKHSNSEIKDSNILGLIISNVQDC
jgi:hypothetical protein